MPAPPSSYLSARMQHSGGTGEHLALSYIKNIQYTFSNYNLALRCTKGHINIYHHGSL